MSSSASLVQQHYSQSGFAEHILAALQAAGKNIDALTHEDLAPVEEFHIGGREATRELAQLAGLKPGMHVLDVGAGIGGPARTLATEFGCTVTGLDLVEEHCRTATELTRRVGLESQVKFQQGDALAMPFPNASFDVVFMEHISMNIEPKRDLFVEIARVLRPDGRFALYEICAGSKSPLYYPVPWADTDEISFLLTPDELRDTAQSAGFRVLLWHDVSEYATAWFRAMRDAMRARPADAPPPLGLETIMGPSARDKGRNLARNLEEDCVRVVQGVLVPASAA